MEAVEAGVPVNSSEALAEKAIWFLGHPEALKKYGRRARQAVLENEGAADKHAKVIEKLLSR